MATWRSRISRRWAAWPWAGPRPGPPGGAGWAAWRWAWPRPTPSAVRWTNGSGSGSRAWARTSSYPTFCAATNCSPRFFPMASKYPLFDRSRLQVKPLAERVNDLDAARWLELDEIAAPYAHPNLPELAARMAAARARGAARILMMGAHVLRAGVNRQ